MKKNKDLYEVLGVNRTASQGEIKKAYYKLAVKLHPDKNPGDQEANEHFQSLQRIYAVLSDPERRKVYDTTGSLEDSEDLAGKDFNDLYKYYRTLYRKVTEEDISAFEEQYRGSEEEIKDLLANYNKFGGNMDHVFQWQMCSFPDLDSHRYMDALENEIKEGTIRRFKPFLTWATQVAKTPRPANPLAKRQKSAVNAASEQALVAAIKGRASQMDSLVASLEAKYGKENSKRTDKNGSGAAAAPAEPTDEEFEAARARLEKARSSKSAPAKGKGQRGDKGSAPATEPEVNANGEQDIPAASNEQGKPAATKGRKAAQKFSAAERDTVIAATKQEGGNCRSKRVRKQ